MNKTTTIQLNLAEVEDLQRLLNIARYNDQRSNAEQADVQKTARASQTRQPSMGSVER